MSSRVGIGYDSHRLSSGRRLVLGGVEVEGAARGLAGHSDADVLTHAVIDALLGAAGLGDIGQHFPDSEERYRDADSISLLVEVRAAIEKEGWLVGNVDVTVICEAPKLSPLREEMAARIGEALALPAGTVNVKFSTNERMGAIGRGEGIAALATAIITPKS